MDKILCKCPEIWRRLALNPRYFPGEQHPQFQFRRSDHYLAQTSQCVEILRDGRRATRWRAHGLCHRTRGEGDIWTFWFHEYWSREDLPHGRSSLRREGTSAAVHPSVPLKASKSGAHTLLMCSRRRSASVRYSTISIPWKWLIRYRFNISCKENVREWWCETVYQLVTYISGFGVGIPHPAAVVSRGMRVEHRFSNRLELAVWSARTITYSDTLFISF